MKKLILSAAIILSAALSVSAQSQSNSQSQSCCNDKSWFVNVAGGASIYGGEHNRQLKLTKLVSYAGDLSVGKWFNPYIAARVSFSDINAKGATWESYIKQDNNGAPVHVGTDALKKNYDKGAQWLYSQQFNAMNLHADIMVNLSNLFGSDEKVGQHTWNASPYVGLGFPYVLSSNGKSAGLPLAVNAGLYNAFPVSEKLDIIADLRGVLLDEEFDGETGDSPLEGYSSLTIGVSFKF